MDQTQESCSGPEGKGVPGGATFLMPSEPPGALVVKTSAGRTWFSVNDRSGPAFQSHDSLNVIANAGGLWFRAGVHAQCQLLIPRLGLHMVG